MKTETLAQIRADIKAAHDADEKYAKTTFNLGTMAQHFARLDRFSTPLLRATAQANGVYLYAGSAYDAPRYREDDRLEGLTEGDLADAMAKVEEADAEELQRLAETARRYERELADHERNRALEESMTPSVGKVARVVRGRKVPIGIQGTITAFYPEPYGKVVIESDGKRFTTYDRNIELV